MVVNIEPGREMIFLGNSLGRETWALQDLKQQCHKLSTLHSREFEITLTGNYNDYLKQLNS